jgi:enterobacterial common antigen flippase
LRRASIRSPSYVKLFKRHYTRPLHRRMSHRSQSYGQILKTSSIIGGAQGINYIMGMVRNKLVALLLGPSGIGLISLYTSATGLVGTVAELGIGSSGVREVAEAHGSGDAERVARTVKTLRRACWITGLLGWALAMLLSYPLSLWTFGSGDRAWAIALLGVTLVIGSISAGQSALLQGTRRIADLARVGMLGAAISTVIAVGFYVWLGERGVVPALIAAAVVNLGASWWFARKIPVAATTLSWRETFGHSKRLISLGVAFMYGAVLAALVGLAIRAIIVRKFGLDANGIYQAAWGISGMFAGFILGAMGADFYPRLTAVAADDGQVNRLVNEQTEIGILLALPGLLATLTFAPELIHLLFSAKFMAGADLLPWFVVGVFGQVITWPLGFIQRAKGDARWIFLSQSHLNLLQLALTYFLVCAFGIQAAAWAFALATCGHGLVVYAIARRLSGFKWSFTVVNLVLLSGALIISGFILQAVSNGLVEIALGAIATAVSCVVSLRGISARLGGEHRVVRMALRLPGGRLLCGV